MVLAGLDHRPDWISGELSKPNADADIARHPQTVRPPSGPAGQDVSLELDAVHGPPPRRNRLAPAEPAVDRELGARGRLVLFLRNIRVGAGHRLGRIRRRRENELGPFGDRLFVLGG